MNSMRPWFAEDIARVLKSVLLTVRENHNADFVRGFITCAIAICTAIGIDYESVKPQGFPYD